MAVETFPSNFHVVIVGAGLVGLASAIFLRNAGYRVTVLERDVELREIGAGIQLPVNSCRVLKDAGVLSRVYDRAAHLKAIVLRSYRNGELLREMNLDPYTQDKYGLPYLVIHRADLRKILYEEAVARGAHIRLGVAIDSQTSDFPNGVIRFSGSREELRVDLVIGADGPQSMCRAALLQRPNNPRPTGITVVRIVVPIAAILDSDMNDLVSPPCVHTWMGPQSLAICYPLKDAFNIVLTRPATPDEVFIGPRPENVEQLRLFFQDWDPKMRKLLDIADDFLKWSLLEVDEPPASFVHPAGKFVLAGDSAHATLPYL
ncbi:hypothetical protein VTN77DRAFT_3771 [Rasamsonia byssochlamydoides]|uniref:uncharacterized protein n=1 Tax=Rasamsonia byssochlamydoides TaxID=89139 RepID=UPI003742EE37